MTMTTYNEYNHTHVQTLFAVILIKTNHHTFDDHFTNPDMTIPQSPKTKNYTRLDTLFGRMKKASMKTTKRPEYKGKLEVITPLACASVFRQPAGHSDMAAHS